MFLFRLFVMIRRPTRSTRIDTLLPVTTHFRSTARGRTNSAVSAITSRRPGKAVCRLSCIRATPMTTPSPSRSEEHTSELQSLMRISYDVFCLQKKNYTHTQPATNLPHIPTHLTPSHQPHT